MRSRFRSTSRTSTSTSWPTLTTSDVDQTVDAAEVDESAEVDDRGDGALEAHALGELGQDLGALVLAAFLEQDTTGKHDVVAVAVHLDDAGLELGVEVHVEVLDAAQVDERCGQEATQADVDDEAALDDFDDLAGDRLASLELLLDGNPGALVLGALLREDQTTVLVFLLQDEGFDLVANLDEFGRVSILANRELADGNDAFGLEADVNQDFVALDLDDRAVDEIALVKLGQGAIDHLIELLVSDVGEVDDAGIFDLGQNGPLSLSGTRQHDRSLVHHVRFR